MADSIPRAIDVPIQVQAVKPWLIPNCDPGCASGGFFFDNTYNLVGNGSAFIGQSFQFTEINISAGALPAGPTASPTYTAKYYPTNIPALHASA